MTAPGPLRPARRRTARALLAVACAAVGLTALLAGSGPGAQPTALVEAADTSQFRAGNIISDQLFYDGNAMSAADVQTFLNSKNPNCKPSSAGVPCLKNATQDTYTRPADSRCPGTYVGARAETAATIIAKVGKACGISQRVLLVILQKEQGLVTLSGDKLTVTRYEKAMGFGCPDTAPCNPAYAHLFNQLYSAARQYQDYRLAPRAIKAGIVNQIRWHPNAGCGSSAVFVENWATAGLYTYTPYQPNAAALRAGSGTGDGCSAYGNRNFWIYYTDWFGSTQVPGAANVTSRYAATGGTTGPLGAIQGSVACGLVGGGCLQHYAKGTIYWSPATGAQIVLYGAARDKWGSTGWERGPLGYPVRDGVCGLPSGGCFQAFQKGSVYWSSATGARVLSGAVLEKWGTTGWERGPLGYPVSDVTSLAGGVQFAHFQGGSVYWSQGTGARVVSGVVRDRWAASGWERGPLGLPVGDVTSLAGGVQFAHFQKGSVYWSQGTGARLVLTPVRDRWAATGWERGPLGLPVSDQVATPGGKGQVVQFQRGWVYWSQATGARLVSGSVRDEWLAAGADGGALGMPLGDVAATADGKAQAGQFQGGWLYVHESLGARVVPVAVRNGWEAAGGVLGSLGYPTSDVVAVAGGRGSVMPFQGGAVFVSAATGGHGVPAALLTAYETAGGPEGLLGFPTAAAGRTPDGKARFQHFQGGSLYFIDGEEVLVPAAVRSVWSRTGWEHGPLGYPTGAAVTTGTLTVQPFQGGTVFTEGAAGGAVRDAFLSTYLAAGGPAVLGVPTAEVQGLSDGKGSLQRFERGSVYSSPATGTRAVTAELLPAWAATGGERGPLGYPTTSATALAVGGGRFAHFQGGSVYWSPATGARVVRGPVRDAWAAAGWERSVLGYPTTDVRTTPDGKAQYAHFQGGSVYWTQATGARVLTAELRAAWAATGWERGPLGYPTTSATALAVGGGRFAHFQGGSVYWSPATGARVVRGPVRDAWAAAGWERSVLGYPTTDVRTTPDGKAQYAHFQGGSVYWTQATGGHALPTVVRDAWAGTGWERGPLGYPTSGARPVPGGTRTDFQRGTISVSSANGAVTVQLR